MSPLQKTWLHWTAFVVFVFGAGGGYATYHMQKKRDTDLLRLLGTLDAIALKVGAGKPVSLPCEATSGTLKKLK